LISDSVSDNTFVLAAHEQHDVHLICFLQLWLVVTVHLLH